MSGTNGTRMALVGSPWQLWGRSLVPSRSARRRSGTGLSGDASSSGCRDANREHAKPCVGGLRVSPANFRPTNRACFIGLPPVAQRGACATPGDRGRWCVHCAHRYLSTIYRSFPGILTHTSAMRRENRSKSLTALGKKLSKNFSNNRAVGRSNRSTRYRRPARAGHLTEPYSAGKEVGQAFQPDDRSCQAGKPDLR